jgi:hypothetical protein
MTLKEKIEKRIKEMKEYDIYKMFELGQKMGKIFIDKIEAFNWVLSELDKEQNELLEALSNCVNILDRVKQKKMGVCFIECLDLSEEIKLIEKHTGKSWEEVNGSNNNIK